MARLNLEQELTRLQHEVMAMGELVIAAILASVDSLRRRDFEAAERIIADDRAINNQRFAIENAILTAMATQQPVARDLRCLPPCWRSSPSWSASATMPGRRQDQLMLGDRPLLKRWWISPSWPTWPATCCAAPAGLFDSDAVTARAIPTEDDRVDEMYNRVARELLTFIMATPRPWSRPICCCGGPQHGALRRPRHQHLRAVVFTVTGA
jgi:phosphate transport system protein